MARCIATSKARVAANSVQVIYLALLKLLLQVRRQYNERYDPYRTKAIVRAITVVSTLDRALRSAADVERLPVGPKSKEKLIEILATGRLGRTEVRE